MLNINDYIITAELKNGKHVVLDPDYHGKVVQYRNMSESEVKGGKLDLSSNHIWLERPMFRTSDPSGQTIIFTDIEGTAVVLQRM